MEERLLKLNFKFKILDDNKVGTKDKMYLFGYLDGFSSLLEKLSYITKYAYTYAYHI